MDMPLAVMAGDGRTRTPTEQDLLRERVADLMAEMNRIGYRKWSRGDPLVHKLSVALQKAGGRLVMDDLGRRMTVEYSTPGVREVFEDGKTWYVRS